MKRVKCFLLAAVLAVTFCSCSDSKPDEIEMIYNEERVEYDVDPTDINIYEGNVYAAQYLNPAGPQKVLVFDETGEKIRELVLDDIFVTHWDIADDRIYVSSDVGLGDDRRMTLYSCDINTGESEEICDFEGLSFAPKIRTIGDKVYWLGQKEEYEIFNESIRTDDYGLVSYGDFGSIFGFVDLNTGEITNIDIPHPIHFSKRNGRLIVYAYEEGKGYCFYDYTADSVVCYTNKLGTIADFEIINEIWILFLSKTVT